MSALAMAMYLTGAGAVSVDHAQRRSPPPSPPVPVMLVPSPPPAPLPNPPAPPAPPSYYFGQRPRADLGALFSIDDYPAAALRGEEQGTTGYRLTIAPNGRVSECAVTQSSGSLALDTATCRIIRSRARFTPARDGRGNPIAGTDSGRVTWRLPPGDVHDRAGIPIPATMAGLLAPYQSYVTARDYPAAALRDRAQGTSKIHVVVDTTGRVIACDVDEGSGSAALDAAACRIARTRVRYTPARDMGGGVVCDVGWGEIVWQPPPPGGRVPRAGPAAAAPPPIETQLAPGPCPGWTR